MAQSHLGPHGATEQASSLLGGAVLFWARPALSIMGRHSAPQLLV